MNNKRLWLLVVGCIALAGCWYWFRPERLFTNKRVTEVASSTTLTQSDQPLYTGTFQGELHKTSGRASVFPAANGDRSLRLTDFKTSNGPDVHVILVSTASVSADKDFALDPKTSIDLGDLKGNEGDQNYIIPAGIDLNSYDVVSIYCVRFHANFGIARLDGRH
jgi:hypothetical protein